MLVKKSNHQGGDEPNHSQNQQPKSVWRSKDEVSGTGGQHEKSGKEGHRDKDNHHQVSGGGE